MLTPHRTDAKQLARLERTSRIHFIAGILAQNYADAGKYHDPKERERINSMIADLRVEAATLYEEVKQEIICGSPNTALHLTEPSIRFSTPPRSLHHVSF